MMLLSLGMDARKVQPVIGDIPDPPEWWGYLTDDEGTPITDDEGNKIVISSK